MDVFFQEWILYPDTASDLFWYEWMLHHPHKKSEVEEARQIILSFDDEGSSCFDKHIEQELARLHAAISRKEQKIKITHLNK